MRWISALADVLQRDQQDPDFHISGYKSGELVTAAFIKRIEQADQEAGDQGATAPPPSRATSPPS